jgi:hypothetical protein
MVINLRFRRYQFLRPTLYKLYLHDVNFKIKKFIGYYNKEVFKDGFNELRVDLDWPLRIMRTIFSVRKKKNSRLLPTILFSLAISLDFYENQSGLFKRFFSTIFYRRLCQPLGNRRIKKF